MTWISKFMVLSFLDPKGVFISFKENLSKMNLFNTVTSLLVCVVAYFSVMPFLAPNSFFSMNIGVYFLGLVFFSLLSLFKIFLYSFFLSQKKKAYISYKDILTISTIVNVKVLFLFPFIMMLGEVLSPIATLLLFFIVGGWMLADKAKLIKEIYEVKAHFVYLTSLVIWAFLFMIPLMMFGHLISVAKLFI